MTDNAAQALKAAETALAEDGFAFVQAAPMRACLEDAGLTDWDGFAASWNRLGLDRYMADGGRYRRRRYATFAISETDIVRKRHQPHYQSRDHNLLNGGIERWFAPIEEAIGNHPALRAALRVVARIGFDLTPAAQRPDVWHCEVHQFRIEALPGTPGQPTPEGMHRDGVDWVLVLMIGRENVERGTTTIHDEQRESLGTFTLTNPLDAALVDDHRVYHGVTAVQPIDPARPSHRDVLVVTLRHQ
ncbi:2OG-Fe dioxygenase family protein [Tanticharoenia sakaeratensis]|uniref:2OG-Fe dioxygenase family protein n=1 Tax=Tanticharoenia sakaeratensis NBRC 103193 TaxID=1231623 RepID=A0A0D6MHG6_9PROT|nr:2OG-Fe dioxygenase family protein [Tanticharoenia sakaeratensis]GAN53072.1 hypothetical protein Tasa_004_137 [Tanticharoenia sakaeratensis NBRC 103193]GBQ19596.1 hypothetical protein AA103193_1086 [Tanticharoenia sakaeratensis NBRC 103193]